MVVSNEDLFAALVLLLSRQLDEEARAKGTQRIGGDYTLEAVNLIHRKKADILERAARAALA